MLECLFDFVRAIGIKHLPIMGRVLTRSAMRAQWKAPFDSLVHHCLRVFESREL
jgi:hypothetical protein